MSHHLLGLALSVALHVSALLAGAFLLTRDAPLLPLLVDLTSAESESASAAPLRPVRRPQVVPDRPRAAGGQLSPAAPSAEPGPPVAPEPEPAVLGVAAPGAPAPAPPAPVDPAPLPSVPAVVAPVAHPSPPAPAPVSPTSDTLLASVPMAPALETAGASTLRAGPPSEPLRRAEHRGALGAGQGRGGDADGAGDAPAGTGGGRGQGLALALPGAGGPDALGEYAGYLAALRERIQGAVRYPVSARRRGLSGTVHIELTILADGAIDAVALLHSSAHAVLDEAALQAVRALGQHPFPPHVPARPLRVRLPIVFALQ